MFVYSCERGFGWIDQDLILHKLVIKLFHSDSPQYKTLFRNKRTNPNGSYQLDHQVLFSTIHCSLRAFCFGMRELIISSNIYLNGP
jgi:hypothetical protein